MKDRLILAMLIAGLGLAAGAVRAPAAVLHDQLSGTGGTGITSTDFPAPMDHLDAQGADDFTVPPGFPWRITSVEVRGGAASGDTVSVFIYEDALALPAAQIFQQGGIPFAFSNTPSIPVAGLALDPGTYWISVQAKGADQFNWTAFPPVEDGDQAVWRNPPGGYPVGCTTYEPLPNCSLGASADFAFRLNGNIASNLFTLGKAKRRRNGTARLGATFPAPGQLVVAQAPAGAGAAALRRKIRPISLAVAAGARTLKIRPTRSARRRLRAGFVVRALLNVTFTPTGGDARTLQRRVKLRLRRPPS